jgi:hypothetical protein
MVIGQSVPNETHARIEFPGVWFIGEMRLSAYI